MSSENETIEDANDLISTADRDMGIDWYRAAKGMIRRLVQWNREKDATIARLEGENAELRKELKTTKHHWWNTQRDERERHVQVDIDYTSGLPGEASREK